MIGGFVGLTTDTGAGTLRVGVVVLGASGVVVLDSSGIVVLVAGGVVVFVDIVPFVN
jgi:hypothetical protein